MHLLSALSVSKQIHLFMALKEYIRFAFKVNCVIALALFFHHLEKAQPSLRYISMTQILCLKHNGECLIIMICLTLILSWLFKPCYNNIILILRCFSLLANVWPNTQM